MSSFGGTVKLTGESEYRKALKEITSSMKVLNSEMKVVTSSYGSADNSQEKLTAQSKVLNKQIEEQKKKVALLEEAYEQSAKETGENSESTKKWATQLNNAKADLNNMTHSLDEFGDEADEGKKKALDMGDMIKAQLISEAIKGGLKLLAKGIKEVGKAFGSAVGNATEYADEMLTLSTQTGLATDTIEKYNAVSELTDVSLDTLTGSMARNIKQMSANNKAYEQLGVSVRDANGELRDGETVYWETIDALGQIPNETERDAMAMSIFGKSAQDLNTIIEMGSDGVKEYTDQAEAMGVVLGGDALNSLGALDDQFQIFKSSVSGMGNIFASSFAPALTLVMEDVNALVGSFNGLIKAVASGDEEAIETAKEQLVSGLEDLANSIGGMLPQVMDIIGTLLESIVSTLINSLPQLVTIGLQMIENLGMGIANSMPLIIQTITTLIQIFTENIGPIVQVGMEIITKLVEGIVNNIDAVINAIVDLVLTVVDTLLDNIDLLIDVAGKLIIGLATGLLKALPRLVEKVPQIVQKIVSTVIKLLPQILKLAFEIIKTLASGIIKFIPTVVKAVPKIISAIVNGLKQGLGKMLEVGKNLLKGIWNGIANAKNWLINKIKSLGKTITNAIKSVFGIHSPSTVFRDEIGTNLALGLGEGFENTMASVSDDMLNSIPTEFDVGADINGESAASFDYRTMVNAFKQALTEVKVELNDREMGGFVTKTVAREVYG